MCALNTSPVTSLWTISSSMSKASLFAAESMVANTAAGSFKCGKSCASVFFITDATISSSTSVSSFRGQK